MFSKQYIVYHLRWQLSTLVMMLPLYFINKYISNQYINLAIVQFIGAILFWYIDKWIFKKKKE